MYQIIWNETAVGTANVFNEGLYYRFHCVCKPPSEGIHRIFVSDGHKELNLGICVPVGQDFVLNTKVPAKYLQSDKLIFYLIPKQKDMMILVKEGMRFSSLNKLDNAYLKTVNGTRYIVIDQSQGQQGSGQNRAHPNK